MKRSIIFEIVACLLALGGVGMFGFGIYPCVNPIQWGIKFGPAYLLASTVSLIASVLIMWLALRLSRHAQRLKEEDKKKH